MQQPTLIHWQPISKAPELSSTTIHVWQIDLTQVPARPEVLDGAEQQRWQAMHHPLAKQRFCATRTAVRTILGEYQGRDPATVAIQLGIHSKPELVNPTPGLFFNLSHSGDLAVLACGSAGPLGIDIECSRSFGPIQRIAERVFDATYQQALQAADYDPTLFLRLWVQWEARQKCLGLGLLRPDKNATRLDFFAGNWDKWQLSLAWLASDYAPEKHFFKRVE